MTRFLKAFTWVQLGMGCLCIGGAIGSFTQGNQFLGWVNAMLSILILTQRLVLMIHLRESDEIAGRL